MKQDKISYFEEKGRENTEATLKMAVETARALDIRNIVLTTTGGVPRK